MKCACLFNPKASGWNTSASVLQPSARRRHIPAWSVSDQVGWISELRRGAVDRLIVCGGDGTLSLVVNRLNDTGLLDKCEIALVPIGTGNDFARSVGLYGAPLEEAWQRAIEGDSIAVDLIRAENGTEHVVVNAATGGFGGLVTSDVNREAKQQWGSMAYWFTAFGHLVDPDRYHVRLQTDDQEVELEAFGLAVTSARYVGGGFPVCPHSYVNDGLLDVTVIPVMEVVEAIAAGVDFSLGRHGETGRVPCFKSRRARISADPILPYSFDGEATLSFDAKFEVMPGAMRMVVGEDALALRKHESVLSTIDGQTHEDSMQPKALRG